MFFSSHMSLGNLIALCRALRHQSAAGVSLVKVFEQQASGGPAAFRNAAKRIAGRLQGGESLDAAMQPESGLFPPLMMSMVEVGRETGSLPEIFAALEEYFRRRQTMQRQFWSQSFLPIVQIIFAFFIIALLIFVLGMISDSRGAQRTGVFGLTGASGALVFLAVSFGVLAALILAVGWVIRHSQHKAALSAILLRLPLIGPCLRALMLGRFAFALHLTLNTAMPAAKALRLSFDAAGNAALQTCSKAVIKVVKSGKEIALALSRCKWFPEDFLNMTAVGEAGGRLPEVMQHQAEALEEEASRRMKAVARTTSFAIWALYAVFVIIAIFRIANVYLSRLGV